MMKTKLNANVSSFMAGNLVTKALVARLTVAMACFVLFSSSIAAQDKYAVVIGVEEYDPSFFENLEYAEDDAVGLGNALMTLDFQTTVMTSESNSPRKRPSNPQKILQIVETVANSCGEGDVLLISLSGHGVSFSDEELLESGVRETYFCPEDANLEDKSTLLPITKLIDIVNSSQATRKLLLIDACRNEITSETAKAKSAPRKIDLGAVHENKNSIPGGMSVLFSCKSSQFSWEHKELGHSVFSNFVIEYLSGKADARYYENQRYDLDGLVYYVRKKTNSFVFDNNLSADGQLPILRGTSANWTLGELTADISADSSLEELEKHAALNNVEALYHLGERYYYGNEVDQNSEKALELYRKAADQDHMDAQYSIGIMTHHGWGTEENYEDAMHWYLLAAEKGHIDSKFQIAELHYYGLGVEQSYGRAKFWYKRAAKNDHAGALFSIGVLYDLGFGEEQNFEEAMNWYKLAAEQDQSDAINAIGVLYRNGEGVEQNYQEAMNWFLRASKLDNANAEYNIGMMIVNGQGFTKDMEKAIGWFKKAAENGSTSAEEKLKELGQK